MPETIEKEEDSKLSTMTVAALNPPDLPKNNEWTITVVKHNGNLVRLPCTEAVSKKSFSLHKYKHHNFLLTTDERTGLVVSVSAIDNPQRRTGIFEVEGDRKLPEDQYGDDVVIQKLDDGSFIPKSYPQSVSVREIDSMLNRLNGNKSASVTRGTKVENMTVDTILDTSNGLFYVFKRSQI